MRNTKNIIFSILLLTAVGGFSACGALEKDEEEVLTGTEASCDWSAWGFCMEFTGLAWTATNATSTCEGMSGTVGRACSTTNLLGSCTERSGTDSEVVHYYYSGDYFTAESAQSDCTTEKESGVWTAS